ncbi:MAG: DnaD domain protein [Chloroflexi bacterium]|nr:DnaD domain protein [Chloroflexota bacterium]
MNQFNGFPQRMQFTPIPNLFLSALLPQIDDVAELKTVLHLFAALYHKRGYPRLVTRGELLENAGLMSCLKGGAEPPGETLRRTLEMAARRGIILHLALDKDGEAEDVYLLNTARDRDVIARIQRGELRLSGLKPRGQVPVDAGERPDIFTLYEQNVGMLTPMLANELIEAEKHYPAAWIEDAIKEAVAANKRSWRYIASILERWSAEGKSDGTHRRGPAPGTDPDKYIKGKYGHMVGR